MKLEDYHNLSIYNWKYKESSKEYGCFYCVDFYQSSILKEDDKLCLWEDTYFCSHCWIDSVIFDNSCTELNKELLKVLNKNYF